MAGSLYIVATPIGNLGDISIRALEILKEVDCIAAEAPSHSRILLEYYGIKTKTCPYHQHNESQFTPILIQKLMDDQNIALISDAGTPLISDPGYQLVCAAHDHGFNVIPIAGPSAIITALSVAGLPVNKFIFEGYLPAKSEARKRYLNELKQESRTLVFYEAPHRILATIKTMKTIFGANRRVTIARELTKQFEQIVRDELALIQDRLEQGSIKIKGEFVVIVEGANVMLVEDAEVLRINEILSNKLSLKDSASLTAKIVGKRRNEVYQLAIKSLQKND